MILLPTPMCQFKKTPMYKYRFRKLTHAFILCIGVFTCITVLASCGAADGRGEAESADSESGNWDLKQEELIDRILETVTTHSDNVLKYGRDRWSGQNTPLFADGLNLNTFEPPIWIFEDSEYFINNFASQQNLMRTLSALSLLTGNQDYSQAAVETARHVLEHHQMESGLLPWGGHQFLDLKTLSRVHGIDSQGHELKRHFPYYQLIFEADSERAAKLVRGIWDSHMNDWTDLFYHSRHGFPKGDISVNIWDRPFNDPEPHQKIPRVGAMVHTSYDLIYAAAHLYHYNNEAGALTWALRKADMWYKARDPETGLGSYYYHLEPTHYPGTSDHRGYEWPPFDKYGEAAQSSRFWARPGWPRTVYVDATIAKLKVAELLGHDSGQRFAYLAESALNAFAVSDAYNYETNGINRLLTDGRVVEEGFDDAGTDYFYAFSLGFRSSGNEDLWPIVRHVAKAHELGDIGEKPGTASNMNYTTDSSDAASLLAFIELHRTLNDPAFLRMAVRIAENILDRHYHYGFFVQSEQHLHVNFDDPEPLALLSLAAELQGKSDEMPLYAFGSPYIHGQYDGEGRTRDNRIIYPETVEHQELLQAGNVILDKMTEKKRRSDFTASESFEERLGKLQNGLSTEIPYVELRSCIINAQKELAGN